MDVGLLGDRLRGLFDTINVRTSKGWKTAKQDSSSIFLLGLLAEACVAQTW